ncbi:MAG: helix-turn-helix transcriptional regulator [Solirubrobacterales bacterium]|nr:helix-turn-helix transcriptional regulator [Solirubrobacterales bacterium]MBV9943604.1 helix-turn-helix transcriptional regulator [Solirubrobacterales bacterium]
MTYEETAGPWPLLARLAMMKGGGAHRGRGRYSRMDDLERLAALRHMRGGPFGGGPFGGGPFGGGRGRRRRGDVRLALLMLLAEEPRNGYQLMQTIEERSGGRWRPSPGSVYPTLSQLEDEGLIRGIERDGTKLFEITDDGRERLGQSKTDPAPWQDGEDAAAPDLHQMASLVIQIGKAAWQVAQEGDERQIEKAQETLAETRRALYRILADDRDPEETDV